MQCALEHPHASTFTAFIVGTNDKIAETNIEGAEQDEMHGQKIQKHAQSHDGTIEHLTQSARKTIHESEDGYNENGYDPLWQTVQ